MKPPSLAPLYATIYPAMAEVARSCGYALAIHGTLGRDLDLVAIPWVEDATDAREVVRAMAEDVARRFGGDLVVGYQPIGTPRPHGREGFSFPLAMDRDGSSDAGYVDVSVMPRSSSGSGEREAGLREAAKALVLALDSGDLLAYDDAEAALRRALSSGSPSPATGDET